MSQNLTLSTDIGDWSDDPAPENDPFVEPPPPPPPTPEQQLRSHPDVWEVRNGEKAHNKGMNYVMRNVVRQENLELIQVYKGLFLAECKSCAEQMILDVDEAERSWSCDACDKKKLGFFREYATPATTHDLAA